MYCFIIFVYVIWMLLWWHSAAISMIFWWFFKWFLKLFYIFFVTFRFTSCDDELDQLPNDAFAPESFYKTQQDFEFATRALYSGLFSGSYYGGSFLRSVRPKKAARADFRPTWADSGPPFWFAFCLIWHFWGGLHF